VLLLSAGLPRDLPGKREDKRNCGDCVSTITLDGECLTIGNEERGKMSKSTRDEGGCGFDYQRMSPFGRALRRSCLAAAASICLLAGASALPAEDLVATSLLGKRGAILETPGQGFLALPDLQGIGDFNGDGLDDVVLAVREADTFHLAVM